MTILAEPLSAWRALEAELAAWDEAGQVATLWWRDDDAVEPTPHLERLLALAQDSGWPLALAVIPARAGHGLARRLAAWPGNVGVLQHGYAHANHAAAGDKRVELGARRALPAVCAELARGLAITTGLFADAALPVLVPPWNRIAPAVRAALPGLGFVGLSTYGPRADQAAGAPLIEVNTHVDLLRWTAPRGFLGEAASLSLLVGHLRARREGRADPDEPTGILTHHLAHDEDAWAFLARLLAHLGRNSAVQPVPARRVFGYPGGGTTGDGA